MISGSGVHLPDTTYGGNPIHWNCADDLNGEPRNLQAENTKLRTLAFYAIHVLEKNGLQSAAKVIESELGIEGNDA